MSKGIIFSIEEFEINDGPGIRKAVFFKGCPLRCAWCHNPEGLSAQPQLMVNTAACTRCGSCCAVCPYPDHCSLCGRCLTACPARLRQLCGEPWDAHELAALLHKEASFFARYQGGVTLTGGEPLLQPAFLLDLLEALAPIHCVVETCGYGDSDVFSAMLGRCQLVYFDLKLMDGTLHRQYTGRSNDLILQNLSLLAASDTPFVARVPLIPGVNDTEQNFTRMAQRLCQSPNLQEVHLLPYHQTAGAKYPMVGSSYHPPFDTKAAPHYPTQILDDFNLKWVIL